MRKPPREFEIFRLAPGTGGMSFSPTGLIVTVSTKTEAVKLAREQLGRGTYEANESSPEIRADQRRRCEETLHRMGTPEVPVLVVGVDLDLGSRRDN